MVALALLIGQQRDPEGEEGKDPVLHVREGPSGGCIRHTSLAEGIEGPIPPFGTDLGKVPSAAGHRAGQEALEEVAPRGDEFRAELPHMFGVERQAQVLRDLEVLSEGLGSLHPEDAGLLPYRCTGGLEDVHDEPLEGVGLVQATASSLTGARISSLRTRTES